MEGTIRARLIARQHGGTSTASIRSFAWILSAGLILLFAVLPWYRGNAVRMWPFAFGVLMVGLAYAVPRALQPVYRAWMAVGHVLGWINSRIILGFIFYVVFLPVGLVRRMGGRGPVARAPVRDSSLKSYRVLRSEAVARERMERPY